MGQDCKGGIGSGVICGFLCSGIEVLTWIQAEITGDRLGSPLMGRILTCRNRSLMLDWHLRLGRVEFSCVFPGLRVRLISKVSTCYQRAPPDGVEPIQLLSELRVRQIDSKTSVFVYSTSIELRLTLPYI